MDLRTEIREFLVSRRAKLQPEDVGLPNLGTLRRVPGLRREEVALLAGVSVEYYTRLERGRLSGVSEDVLEAIAHALRLDEIEHAHLFNLARVASHAANDTVYCSSSTAEQEQITPSQVRILDSITSLPAFIRNGRLDILAINELGRAVYSEVYRDSEEPANLARFCFLSPRARTTYRDWEKIAASTAAILHAELGRNPHDAELCKLIHELSTLSEEFDPMWAKYEVGLHVNGDKDINHPLVGDLHMTMDAMALPTAEDLALVIYSTEPHSVTEERLAALAEWAANEQHAPLRS
ncbi:helix-turn-helix transcriptional regulator [Corynebacterium sp. L4756]|uniref:helix-turn-helix transcriptional regulator n=1 Tax=unclassified Corynebacterium TaxID=2624378 RepID=UPI00374DC508